MKKAIAIPYVVAIILGIIIVGVIGYWLFLLYGGGVGTASEAVCRSKLLTYCSEWAETGYSVKPGGKEFSKACGEEGVSNTYAPECCAYSWASDVTSGNCQKVLKR